MVIKVEGINEIFLATSSTSLKICYFPIAISKILIVDYTMSVSYKVIKFSSFKIWAWLQPDHTQIVSVIALRASLVEIFKDHH